MCVFRLNGTAFPLKRAGCSVQAEYASIYAICNNCKNKIIVYDLLQYPAAVVLNKTYDFERVIPLESELYVNYEYSDEYLYENDVEFDNNDISWARAFIVDENDLKQILDDETT